MRIREVLDEPALSGFYRDDQAAIRGGAHPDAFLYIGEPVTDGFTAVREAGRAVTVLPVLEDGRPAVGDCAEVQYAGVGGSGPLFNLEQALDEVRDHLAPFLIGRAVDHFRSLTEEVDQLAVGGRPLLTAVRCGISQALLHPSALPAVNSVEQALADHHPVPREMIVESEHPHFGVVRQVAAAVRVSDQRPTYRRPPRRNQHGEEILDALLGYEPAKRDELARAGAFGPATNSPALEPTAE